MSIQSLADGMGLAVTRELDPMLANVKATAIAAASLPQFSPPPPDSEHVKAAAQQLDSYLKSTGRSLEFRVEEKSGRVIVKVHNSVTGEVIRQIPDEETLRMAESLPDPLNGGNAMLDVHA
jgi:flagellar protein FlaG